MTLNDEQDQLAHRAIAGEGTSADLRSSLDPLVEHFTADLDLDQANIDSAVSAALGQALDAFGNDSSFHIGTYFSWHFRQALDKTS